MPEKQTVRELLQKDYKILAAVIAVAGVLLFTLVPVLVIRAMDLVLKGIAIKVPLANNSLLATAPRIVIAFFPVWGGWSVAAGIALLLLSHPMSQGKKWVRPVAVGLLTIPAVTGAYFSGPIMFFATQAAPIFVTIGLIGLIPYFLLLLWGAGSGENKLGKFFLFLMLGVTAALSFSNGGSSLRMFWARPEPYVLQMGHYGFLLGIPVIWTGVVTTLIGIPFLSARKELGFRLSAIGVLIIFAGNAILWITHTTTKEFVIGMVMAVITMILLLLPGVGRRMLDKPLFGQAAGE